MSDQSPAAETAATDPVKDNLPTRSAARQRAERARYRELEQRGIDWCRRNPDACPDCKGRPGKGDYADDGGADHAPWCKA